MKKLVNLLRIWATHYLFGTPDYSIKKGDEVTMQSWTLTSLHVVDLNWATVSAAISLGDHGRVMVVPISSLTKVTD